MRMTPDPCRTIRRAAVISAICFAYCPYVVAHTPHIQLLMTAGLPFSMLAFHRLADSPTAGRGVTLGLTMAMQALFCGYYAVFVLLIIGFAVLVVAAVRRRWRDVRYWTAISIAAANGFNNDGTKSIVTVRFSPQPYLGGPNEGVLLPKGYVDIHIDLPRPLRDWAKRQPEGVSALVRRLLAEERTRPRGAAGAQGTEGGS